MKKEKVRKDKKITIRIDTEFNEVLKILAECSKVKVSEQIRIMLKEYYKIMSD